MTVLVDSDILIEVSRGRDPEIVSRWELLSNSDAVILYSPVSAAELWAGARPSEHEALNALFAALICTEINADTGKQAGEYMRQFAKSHALELGDALIASATVQNGATLWTRNRKHYPMKDIHLYR